KAGLIRRVEAEGDGRSLPVELTPEGIRRATAAFREDMAIEAAMLSGLTPEEQSDLARLLRKLALTITDTPPFD
ncbi:MAG TPA: MarR family transcriptional regulator, partial [Microvirga sp.]|nr:MarR family transcriptional regulator [Microvirga sp.]